MSKKTVKIKGKGKITAGVVMETKKKVKKKKRIYLAAPFFNDKERQLVDTLKLVCESFGFEVFSPKDDNLIKNFDSIEERQKSFNRNIEEVKNVDLLLAVIDDWDCRTVFEMGMAYLIGTPIFAYSNVQHRKLNLMIAHACCGFANGIEELKQCLKKMKKGTYKNYIYTGDII